MSARAVLLRAVVVLLTLVCCRRGAEVRAQETSGKKRPANRLAGQTSPYLLQHAHNPVDWYPWGPEALKKARVENKPIFLSVGYSTCYWCHVMEREVFENEAIAAYMNEHFVNIKVDREERPDIDDQYMLALQLYFRAIGSPQSGGWPMSMFLTPEGKPFAGGTYFPAEDKPGQPGFPTVLRQVHELWSTREKDIRNNAEFLASAVKRQAQPGLVLEKVELDRSLIRNAVQAVIATYDAEYGGFGFDPAAPAGPKFPDAPRLRLLQAWIGAAEGEGPEQAALIHTLNQMSRGGIRDHLGGGFHRYSVDREWRVPHFEKMLYDQALLASVYFDEYTRTQDRLYRQVAEETLDFVLRELTSPEGAFYSALDAETDGIEGQYYVWSREEIDAILGEEDARVFCAVYGLDEESRFEHGHALFLPQPVDAAAEDLGMPVAELETQLAGMRNKLLAARQKRPALRRDEKILTSWNGLMIRALARAGTVDGNSRYVEAAERAARFVLDHMRDAEGRLLHSYADGSAGIRPYLDDYAYVISGLLMLSKVSGNGPEWLRAARSLMDQQFVMYWDERGHGFFYTAEDHEPLLARMKDANDSALPSANAISVQNLLELSEREESAAYREPALQMLRVFAPALQQSPAAMPTLAAGLNQYLAAFGVPPREERAEVAAAQPRRAERTQDDKLIPLAEASVEDARKHDKVTATAYLSVDKAPPGGECRIAVVLDIREGWHINANPAQPEFLIPTEITGKLPEKIELADVKYPPGMEFAQQGTDEPLLVYEGRVLLLGTLKVPREAAGRSGPVEVTVRYQACNDRICLRPMKLILTGELAVAAEGEPVRPINQSLFQPRTE